MNIIRSSHEAVIAMTVAEPTVAMHYAVEAIALNRLVPSPANVRRTNAAAGISELADSIEAHGLIHNLTVRKAKKGKYEVVAGSRRLAALRLLAKEGRLTPDAGIPCSIRNAESDTELSLAENVQREAMHIVDEILSYRQLAADGMAPENIAARLGQSVITIRQRLLGYRWANLKEPLGNEGIWPHTARLWTKIRPSPQSAKTNCSR
ncbi:ParB/RepB/Spo0J family partition protein [Agrobacterium sp. NPDC089420]|uniref:ParB/RepB/Spo0J family partition protein n=1 Tax=Agrobacterium sp. NPDC089420 TaxID=3363918 RepID=UPI00384D8A96